MMKHYVRLAGFVGGALFGSVGVKLLSSKGIVEGQQADEEIAPAHDPSQKTAGPGAICSGACCHFLWKKIMLFRGAAGPQHLR